MISDIEMPLEDGYTLIRKIRSELNPPISQIPAIALTAHANKEDKQRALASGFQIHVKKPVEPVELIEALCSLLEKQPQDSSEPIQVT